MDYNSKYKSKYHVGNVTTDSWSSVYFYSPHILATYENKGEIFAVISLAGPSSFDSSTGGNLLLDELHESYFESEDESCLVSLEKAVLKTKKRLLELLKNDEKSSQEGIEFNLISGVIQNKIMYLALMGGGKLYGFREGDVSDITSILKDPDNRGEIKTGSFQTKRHDKFLFLSPAADTELENEDVETILNKNELNALKGKNTGGGSQIAALLLSSEDTHTEDLKPAVEIDEEELENEEIEDKNFEDQILINKQDKTLEKEKMLDNQEEIDSRIVIQNKRTKTFEFQQNLRRIKSSKNAKTFQVILISIYEILQKLFKSLYSIIVDKILDLNPQRPFYLKNVRNKINWRPIVLIVLIIGCIGWYSVNSYNTEKARKEKEIETKLQLDKIESSITQIGSDIDILIMKYDSVTEKTQKITQLNNLKQQVTNFELYEEKKNELLKKISTFENQLSRKIVVESPTIVKDLGLLEGTMPTDIDISGEFVLVSEKNEGKIYKFNYDGGDVQKIGSGLNKPRSISVTEDGNIIFVDENADRSLGSIQITDGSVERFVGINDARLGKVVNLDAYKVGDGDERLYGVRSNTKEVIQMKKSTNGYSLPELRLPNQNFGNLLDVEVNEGRIYVLSEGQGVRRFYGQNEFENSVHGMTTNDNWNGSTSLCVDKKFIYLSDTKNKRILVYTKRRGDDDKILDFIAQYDLSKVEGADKIIDIASDKDKNLLFVLMGTKVVKLDLTLLIPFVY